MNCHSMAHEVKTAIQRAKHKISSLENELCARRESCSEGEEESHQTSWKLKQELKDSLVDMYKANPKVNEELKQRLPSPIKRHCSETTPQPGVCGEVTQPDIAQAALETAAPEKKLKGPDSPKAKEDPVRGSSPPPPPPLPAPVRNIEEVMLSPQRSPSQLSLDREETANVSVSKSLCITPEPTAPRRITDEGNGNSKLSHDSKRQVPFLDKEKNISFLLKELDSLRDLNKKLQDKLALKEKELETMRLDNQLQEEKLGAHACERAAALVEEIYKAQRERDQAVMARLRLANEERDEALLRAKKLQETALELENINPEETDMDLEELLNRVSSADSALSIEQSGMAIMERIQRARERRSKITSEEMKAVIEERDNALTKCKRLEQEVLHTKEMSQTNTTYHLNMTNNQERVRKIQAELESVQRERDMAVELRHKLEEELQVLRRCHSAQQVRTDESSKKETPCLSSPTCSKDNSAPQSQNLLSRVQQLTSEIQSIQTQLRVTRESEREANEKVHKLERLVDVLRKKVGTGSVRTVI